MGVGAKPARVVSPETRAKISATLKRKGIRPPTGHLTLDVRAKISATLTGQKHDEARAAKKRGRTGSAAAAWKGDVATKEAKHIWLTRHYPKSGCCDECGQEGKTQYAFKHHPSPHTRDRADYRELCDRCHRQADIWLRPWLTDGWG